MTKLLLLTSLLAISIIFSSQQVTQCPPLPKVIDNFNQSRYLGRWFQNQGIPTSFSPSGTTCIAANYGLRTDGNISVRNTGLYFGDFYTEICGYAYQKDPDVNNGNLSVKFPFAEAGSYYLIGTDYDNYASVWSCDQDIGGAILYGWVLTREQFPNNTIVDQAFQHFIDNDLPIENFEPTLQGDISNCIYEPPNGPNCIDESN